MIPSDMYVVANVAEDSEDSKPNILMVNLCEKLSFHNLFEVILRNIKIKSLETVAFSTSIYTAIGL